MILSYITYEISLKTVHSSAKMSIQRMNAFNAVVRKKTSMISTLNWISKKQDEGGQNEAKGGQVSRL